MAEFNMQQFRDKFVEEAKELISKLETDLLVLEKNPGEKELIEAVFRAMHTLKGVSAMYGFDCISEYTHSFENIYQLVRDGLISLTKEIFNLTFQSVDHLRNLLEDANIEKQENKIRQNDLIAQIKAVQQHLNIKTTEYQSLKKKEPEKIDKDIIRTWYILLKAEEQLIFRGIKILNIFHDLSKLGIFEVIKPPVTQHADLHENEEFWGVFLSTKASLSEIEDVFLFILDDCKITKLADFDLFDFDSQVVQQKVTTTKVSIPDEDLDDISILEAVESGTLYKPVTAKQGQTGAQEEKSYKNEAIRDLSKQMTSRISVSSEKLDRLIYLVSELVTSKSELLLSIGKKDYDKITEAGEKIDKLSKMFRENALSIRLVPVKDMLVRFKRLVRDLSQNLGKLVDFEIHGEETELDKNVIDAIAEPLMHIIRNCLDHGIEAPEDRVKKNKPEAGILKFAAFQSGNFIFIQVGDDGKGIDPEIIRKKAIEKGFIAPDRQLTLKEMYDLIFLPGFSTAQSLTEVSGRGVGMDVVKKKIQEIRGETEIESEVGLGTTFTIKLQQTISIIDTLLFKTSASFFSVPVADIESCLQAPSKDLYADLNRRITYQDSLIPFVSIREVFNLKGDHPENEQIIIINKNKRLFGISIDIIIGEFQAVIKPLSNMFKDQKYLSGCSILGDGNLALILDTAQIYELIK